MCFRILVFHLEQKHEEGQRLLHYLQHTNTALAMCKCMCVRNKETCKKYVEVVPALSSEKGIEIFSRV